MMRASPVPKNQSPAMSTPKVGSDGRQRLGARHRVTGTVRSGRSQASQFPAERVFVGGEMGAPIAKVLLHRLATQGSADEAASDTVSTEALSRR